jgi:hypothetical protein
MHQIHFWALCLSEGSVTQPDNFSVTELVSVMNLILGNCQVKVFTHKCVPLQSNHIHKVEAAFQSRQEEVVYVIHILLTKCLSEILLSINIMIYMAHMNFINIRFHSFLTFSDSFPER